MAVKASQNVAGAFVTRDATGAITAASVVDGVLYVNGSVASTISVPIDTTDAPFYSWSCTLPSDVVAGDIVQVMITATIGGVVNAATVWMDSVYYEPSAAPIAVAVLTADLSDNAASGNLAEGVTMAVTTPPSASAIASEVDIQLSNSHGDGSWGAAAGSGGVSYQWPPSGDPATVDGVARDGIAVWITSDEAGTTVVAGPQYTLASGYVAESWLLDAGTYYAWLQLSGANFTNPTQIEVTE
jgi:hypothetical protein